MTIDESIERAARAIKDANALLIAAGAGIGVDSGLPDFRGNEGFWTSYPMFRESKLSFAKVAQPIWFERDPALAWGFYGHRLNMYRATPPHAGFAILRKWADAARAGSFVFTSNVDGHFEKAGFDRDRIFEAHGSIHHVQCTRRGCRIGRLHDANHVNVVVDPVTLRARPDSIPHCVCGAVQRPNVMMFGDNDWCDWNSNAQEQRFDAWRRERDYAMTTIEIGAGTAIPGVRMTTEWVARGGHPLIRINPREPEISSDLGGISIALGGLEALTAIDAALEAL